jgi:hypothetical protein
MNIQQDLQSVILFFRSHQVILTANTSKMHQQIRMHPEDTRLQTILWRKTEEEPMWICELMTVTCDMVSSSFLPTHCLKQLAEV